MKKEVAPYKTPERALALKAEVERFAQGVEALEVETDAEAHAATELLAVVSRLRRKGDSQRKADTKPLLDEKRFIDGQYKTALEPLEHAERVLKRALSGFAEAREREVEAARQAALEAAKEEQERAQTEAFLAGDDGPAAEVQPVYVAPPAKIETAAGKLVPTKRWKFEVEDVMALMRHETKYGPPPQFFKVDEAAIRSFMHSQVKAGEKPALPGVRFYQEIEVHTR